MVEEMTRRILIVDDDEVIGSLLAALLADAGYDPQFVACPTEAQGTYDLVISDYLAPNFAPNQPWPHLERLRQLSAGAPIVGCTAHQDAAAGEPATLGVAAVVVKPFDLDDVLTTVEQLLAGKPAAAPALCN